MGRRDDQSGQPPDIKSICKLLIQCQQSGVTRLKLGDLEVRFNTGPLRHLGSQQGESDEFEGSTEPTLESGADTPKVPKDVLERFAEEQSLFDSPLAFEDQQVDLHLGLAVGKDEEP